MKVRLVDDDPDLLAATRQTLRIAGFEAEAFSSAIAALEGITADFDGVILTDVRMPHMDGLEFHARLRAIDPELPVILVTGHGDVEMAVGAMRNGAWDFLTKPVSADQLTAALRRAVHARGLVLENRALRAMPRSTDGMARVIGDSPAMVALRSAATRLAEAGADVLLTGPSGAGKETLARAIHASGPRKSRGFVHVPCDTLDPARFDSDYAGAEAGHGGTRHARQIGRFERAHRGVLFLDHVEALGPALQTRILDTIESGSFWPLGATAARPLDVQVIASTGVDLAAMVADGTFRADLYYRLSGITLALPALSGRPADIPLAFRHFLLAAAQRLDQPLPQITPLVQARLTGHDWPGNLRELSQYATSVVLGVESADAPAQGVTDLAGMVAGFESGILRAVLTETRGNATRAMARLGLPRKTFYDKLSRHGLRAEDFRR